jgi:hypothetical protein
LDRRNIFALILCLCALPASAQTIINVTGTSAGEDNELATTQSSWTQTATYTNVTIQATLDSCAFTASGTAYLTLNGTALANQIATNGSVSFNGGIFGGDAVVTLFSGLTLGPGTYYLTINPSLANSCDELWQNISGAPTVTTGSGVTAGSSGGVGAGHLIAAYPPASTFGDPASFLFSVTGTLTTTAPTTPIPPTAILLGVGLLLLFWYAWRFRKQESQAKH